MTKALVIGEAADVPPQAAALFSRNGGEVVYANNLPDAQAQARLRLPQVVVYVGGAAPAAEELVAGLRANPNTLDLPVMALEPRDPPAWRHAFEFGGDLLLTAPFSAQEIEAAIKFLAGRREAVLRNGDEQRKRAEVRAMYKAEETERKRIGEELHDGILPLLASGKMHMEAQAGKDIIPWTACRQLMDILDDAISDIRHLMNQLSPSRLQKIGLAAFLENMVTYANGAERAEFTLETRNLDKNVFIEELVQRGAARIVQEIIHNTLKYAEAEYCRILVARRGDELYIETEDNGVGFDFDRMLKYESPEGGRGLKNILNRAKLLNGTAEVDAAPGEGARFRITIPC